MFIGTLLHEHQWAARALPMPVHADGGTTVTCLGCSDALTIHHVLGIFTIENPKTKTITVFAACRNARLQLDQCPSAWYIRIYNSHYPTAIPHKFLCLQEIPHKCLCLQIVALLRQDAHQHHTGHNNSCELCQ